MTKQGLEHCIHALTNARSVLMTLGRKMQTGSIPVMTLELVQEAIVLCREDIKRKEEKERVQERSDSA
jgi:hypothetical protein